MDHNKFSDNLMSKVAILKLLCSICKSRSTHVVYCNECSTGYCNKCSKRLTKCLNCNSEVLITKSMEEKEEKNLANVKMECRSRDSLCGKNLPASFVTSQEEEYKKNNIRNGNDENMDDNISENSSQSVCNLQTFACKHIKILCRNMDTMKENIQQVKEELIQRISTLEKKIDKIQNCCVCKVRGKSKLCSSCNFKSCTMCNLYCLVCCQSMCLNCQPSPKVSCSIKKCKNILCFDCQATETEISNLFKKCHFCRKLNCQDDHSLRPCDFCLERFCKECLVKCEECNGKFCIPCDGKKLKKDPLEDYLLFQVGVSFEKKLADSNSYCKDHKVQKSVLIGCGGGSVINFDTIEMKVIDEFSVATEFCKVSNILTVNGKVVTGLADEYKIKIWNNRNFDTVLFSEIDTGFAHEIKHLRDDIILMVTQIPHQCLLIDISQNKVLQKITFEDIVPNAMCKVNNLKTLVGFHNGLIKLWDLPNNKLSCEINAHAGKIVNSIIKLEQSDGFMSSGQDRSLKIWRLDEGIRKSSIDILPEKMMKANVTLANWSKIKELRDGRIAHCAGNRSISIWDLKSMTNMILKSHSNSVYDFLQISDNILLSCSEDRCVKAWDLRKNDTLLDSYSHKSILYRFEI